MSNQLLTLSPSPHVKNDQTITKIMYGVVIAMIPAMIISFLYFGFGAIKVTVVAVISCLVIEAIIQKYLMKTAVTINDGSALVTGILLAFNLPSNLPCWMIIVGSLAAIGIGKMSFGGLGNNPFNPALVGRVFLLISFPAQMTSWPKPNFLNFSFADAETGATALGIMKDGLKAGTPITELLKEIPSYSEMFLGQVNGSLGEVSALALIIGGLYMLYKKIITWHIPVSFIGTVFAVSGILYLFNDQQFANPLFHMISGGLILGAVYMATDMVSTPMTKSGMILFGIGCGLLTIVIRMFGAYPEGVSFAILIMNAVAPIINIYIKPKRFGVK